MTPAGIEPAIFRIVAQHLNHCATAVALCMYVCMYMYVYIYIYIYICFRPFRVWYPEKLKAFIGEITEHRVYVYIPPHFLFEAGHDGCLDLVNLSIIQISLKRGCLFRGTDGLTELHSSLHSNSNAPKHEDERCNSRELKPGPPSYHSAVAFAACVAGVVHALCLQLAAV